MEIYKLSDEVPEGKRRRERGRIEKVDGGRGCRDGGDSKNSSGNGGDSDELIITEMKAGVKNPERVNVYVNSKFAFSLDVAQAVEYKLKIGAVLSREQLTELKKASEFGEIYQRTLEWVLMRPRSLHETRDYLFRKLRSVSRGPSATNEERGSEVPPVTTAVGAEQTESLFSVSRRRPAGDFESTGGHERVREEYSEFSEEIVSRLVDRGYLDDRRFAEFWVENRFVKKGVSRKRLRMELAKKGVTKEIIDEVLDVRDDEEELRKMITRKWAKYDDKQKLMAYLCRQGFSYDLVRNMIDEMEQ